MRRIVHGLALVCVVLLLLAALHSVGLLTRLEWLSRDVRQKSGLGRKAPESSIAVAWIDQESIDQMRRESGLHFPWPRVIYVDVVRFLRAAGARAIVFDLLFSEPMNGADDDALAEAIAEPGAPVILSYVMVGWRRGGFDEDEDARFLARGRTKDSGLELPADLEGVNLPIPALDQATPHSGFVNLRADRDDKVRRMQMLRVANERVYPALALATAEAVTGARAEIAADHLRLGERRVALEADGSMALNFRGAAFGFEHFKLFNILASHVALADGGTPLYDPERFRDRIVIVGANAEGYEDALATPVAAKFPGPELHATALANLLAGDALQEYGGEAPSAGAALLIGVAVPLVLSGVWSSSLVLVLIALAWAVAACLAFSAGMVLPLATPLISLILAAGAAFVYRLIVEGRQKRELRRAFSSYMAPEVVREVLSDPKALSLGGEERTITVLFSDLAGFTGLSEATTPQQLVQFLNDYFTRMGDHVMRERGVIDKFIGDAIMALFGAPVGHADHARSAIAAALACQDELTRINQELQQAQRPQVAARIGIHTGIAVVGNMGSARRFDYTAMGDTVNLASRLEGANKPFGTALMVSESSWRSAEGAFRGREIGKLRVVGRAEALTVWEPLAVAGGATRYPEEFLEHYDAALKALRATERAEAQAAFERAARCYPADKLTQAYLRALTDSHWDGVFALDSK